MCAGTHSALLVSRSATRGLVVFRMMRDDAYLACMLRVLGRLWREHVLPRRPPPRDLFASWAEYHALLSSTVTVRRVGGLRVGRGGGMAVRSAVRGAFPAAVQGREGLHFGRALGRRARWEKGFLLLWPCNLTAWCSSCPSTHVGKREGSA